MAMVEKLAWVAMLGLAACTTSPQSEPSSPSNGPSQADAAAGLRALVDVGYFAARAAVYAQAQIHLGQLDYDSVYECDAGGLARVVGTYNTTTAEFADQLSFTYCNYPVSTPAEALSGGTVYWTWVSVSEQQYKGTVDYGEWSCDVGITATQATPEDDFVYAGEFCGVYSVTE
jgi:hypothetical protein